MKPRPLGEFSRLQRDVLAALAAVDEPNGREVWTAVEEIEEETRTGDAVYYALDELADRGLVVKEKVHDQENAYTLTHEAEKLLLEEDIWFNRVR